MFQVKAKENQRVYGAALIYIAAITFLISRAVIFDAVAPFGLAYFAATYRKNWRSVMIFMLGTLGVFSVFVGSVAYKYLFSYIAFSIIFSLLQRLQKEERELDRAVSAAVALFLVGFMFVAAGGFVAYDVLMLPLESVLCLISVLIMERSVPIFWGEQVTAVALEEIISAACVVGLCILGFSGVSLLTGLSLGNTLCILVIMLVAQYGAAFGTLSGIGTGFVSSIGKFPPTSAIGIYGFCGFISGIMGKFGKLGTILGFAIANAFLSIYIGGWGDGIFSVYEIALASIIFFMIPTSVMDKITQVINSAKELKMNRIEFNLAKIFKRRRKDVADVIESAVDTACAACEESSECWQREYSSTYDSIMKMKPHLEEYGEAIVPEYFAEKCANIEGLLGEVEEEYSRFSGGIEFIKDKELDIISYLGAEGVRVSEATVLKTTSGRYQAEVKARFTKGAGDCIKKIERVASEVMGRHMTVKEKDFRATNRCVVRLVESQVFEVLLGVSARAGKGQRVSGDNYVFLPEYGGKCIVALSDGMGIGTEAAAQSTITVELLEEFIKAGFDKISAIRLINSVLMLKLASETSVTIDISVIDLYTGDAEFIKIGANTSYVKRNDEVSAITANSLPAGILKDVDVETTHTELKGGEFIVLLSDGVEDELDRWVGKFLEDIEECEPGKIASGIIRKAKMREGEHSDDMTTVVLRVARKN